MTFDYVLKSALSSPACVPADVSDFTLTMSTDVLGTSSNLGHHFASGFGAGFKAAVYVDGASAVFCGLTRLISIISPASHSDSFRFSSRTLILLAIASVSSSCAFILARKACRSDAACWAFLEYLSVFSVIQVTIIAIAWLF